MMKNLRHLLVAALLSLLLFSCRGDNDNPSIKPNPWQNDYRVFVLNEGIFGKTSGVLHVITPERKYLTDQDKKTLGGTAQDLAFVGDSFLVVCKDPRDANNPIGRLVCYDTKTLEFKKDYTDVIKELIKPSHLIALDLANVYIRDAKGIYRVDLVKGTATFVNETISANELSLVKLNGMVYASVQNKLISIKDGKVEKTLPLGATVKGIAYDGSKYLYVAAADDAQIIIYRVDPSTLTIESQNTITGTPADQTMGNNYWARSSAVAVKGDTLYFAGNTSKIYRHLYSKKETKEMVDTKDPQFYPVGTITYQNPGVHPLTGHIYISRYKGFGPDAYTNAILEFDLSKDKPVLVKKVENVQHFLAGFYFPANAGK